MVTGTVELGKALADFSKTINPRSNILAGFGSSPEHYPFRMMIKRLGKEANDKTLRLSWRTSNACIGDMG